MIFLLIFVFLFFSLYLYKNYYKKDWFIFFSYFALVLFLVNLILFTRFPFSPDSFSYFDISNYIFTDFGRINTIRQYVAPTRLNISFPPLLPFFIAIINLVFNLGMLSGVVLNLYIALITVVLLDVFFRKLNIKPVYAVIISYLLILNFSYLDELLAARAIPLNLLLFTIVIYLFTNIFSNTKVIPSLLLIGILNGLMVLNRFDHIFTLLAITVYLLFLLFKLNKLIYFPVFALSLVLTVSPWITYSIIHFGTIFITDNSSTFILVYPENPLRFQSSNFYNPDIFNSFFYWVRSFIFVRAPNVGLGILGLSYGSFPIVVFILMSSISIFFKSIKENNWLQLIKHPIIAILGYTIFRTSLFFLVGYGDSRYHLETLFLFSIMVVIFMSFHENDFPNLTGLSLYLVISSVLFTTGIYLQSNLNRQSLTSISHIASRNLIESTNLLTTEENELNRYLSENSLDNVVILNLSKAINSFRFGALTDNIILTRPRINEADYDAFLEFPENYHFDYVIFDNETIEEFLNIMGLKVEYSVEISEELLLVKVSP